MTYIAEIDIMPHDEILDPQGKAVQLGLHNLQLDRVADVRIGKHVRFRVEADDEATARAQAETACKRLLANPVVETYSIRLTAA